MHHFYEPEVANEIKFLNEEESKHALKVLRLRKGDKIELLDGKGGIYECMIVNEGKKCEFEVVGKRTVGKTKYPVHIAITPTKNQERIEWFTEKATEIGVDRISFIITKNTEKSRLKTERIIKKAIGAMKQSMNLWLPEVETEISFLDFIEKTSKIPNKYIAYVDQNHTSHLINLAPKRQPTLVMIGPEGDFSKEEIKVALEYGYEPVSLGPNRLRTETAGMVACHTLNLINL